LRSPNRGILLICFSPCAVTVYGFQPPRPVALRQNANDWSEIALVRSWSSLQ
jgi:hypothetical protein